ncbi:MAG TPA: potassium channel protein [Armatimonadota bacterium]|nr:potassium channel protein [Armatimonadota bacterium]
MTRSRGLASHTRRLHVGSGGGRVSALFWRPLVLAVLVLAFGTFGYMCAEGWPFLDSLYMTIITMTTVGFGEVRTLDPVGQEFTIVLVIVSVVVGALVLGTITSFVVEGHLHGAIVTRRLRRRLSRLKDHIVVCGFGRMGMAAVRSALQQGATCVAIDEHPPDNLPDDLADVTIICGDATVPEVLSEAGVERAAGVVCALDTDAENLMLALTLQEMAPDARVVARSTDEPSEALLARAGADVVICPYRTAGFQMAAALLRPGVHSFLQVMAAGGSGSFRLNEVTVPLGSHLIGMSLAEMQEETQTDVRIVGVGKPWGEPIINPSGSTIISEGDQLILVGTEEQVNRLLRAVERPARPSER